ncbi:MAG: hypothetical protein AB7I96_13015 [Candidatus Dadabacteria bacterium]
MSTNETPAAPPAAKSNKSKTKATKAAKPITAPASLTHVSNGKAIDEIKAPVYAFGDKDFAVLSNKEADAAIEKLLSSGKSFRKLAHVTAVGIMLHFEKHGDYTKLNRLYAAVTHTMSKAMARGLIEWVERFSTVRWSKDKAHFFKPAKSANAFNLKGDPQSKDEREKAGAMNLPFWSGQFGDREAPSFNFGEALSKLYERATNALKAKDEAETKAIAKRFDVDKAQLAALEKLAHNMGVKLKEATPAGNA